MTTSEKVAKALLEVNAIATNIKTPYQYANGMLSPIYVDCRMIPSFPKERKVVIESCIESIKETFGRDEINVVVGSGHSGITLATFISEKMNIPMAYVRASAKEYGKKKAIEGVVNSGDKALIICDIFGTEGHVENTVRSLEEAGVKVVGVLTIFDLNLGIVTDFLTDKKIKTVFLTDLKEVLKVASAENIISEGIRSEVSRWISDPKTWDKSHKQLIEGDIEKARKLVAGNLLEIKAVTLSPNEPFKYTSGILSPIYTDNRLWMSYPKEWKQLIDAMISILVYEIGISNIDVIAGTSTAGISHATYLAEKLNMPLVYVKSKAEDFGKRNKVEGHLEPGKRVLIIEDLISTGGSSVACVEAVREAGGLVSNCMAIFTYGLEKSKKIFAEHNVELYTVTDFATLTDVAAKKGFIKPAEKELVLSWRENPDVWGR